MIAHAGASREQTPRSRPAPSATGARRGGGRAGGGRGQAMGGGRAKGRWAMGAGAGRPGAIGGARRGRQGDAQRDPDGRWGVSGQFRYGLRCRRRLHPSSLTSSNLFSQVRSYSEKTMSPRRRSRCVNRGEIGHKSENSVPGRPSPVCQRRIRRPDRPAGAPPRITRRPLRRHRAPPSALAAFRRAPPRQAAGGRRRWRHRCCRGSDPPPPGPRSRRDAWSSSAARWRGR